LASGLLQSITEISVNVKNPSEMIRIDGSLGEGGGQVLRSSLTLSLLTGTPVEIHNIRAHRPKPGLMTQHLFAVQAAAAVGDAQVDNIHLGSAELSFAPCAIRSGDFRSIFTLPDQRR
jgi:RNA 3'-terminal phosphate cyclase (ATP)